MLCFTTYFTAESPQGQSKARGTMYYLDQTTTKTMRTTTRETTVMTKMQMIPPHLETRAGSAYQSKRQNKLKKYDNK